MALNSQFVEYVLDQLAASGPIRSRNMFGGVGVYVDKTFVQSLALITDFSCGPGPAILPRPGTRACRSFPVGQAQAGLIMKFRTTYWKMHGRWLNGLRGR